MKVLLVYWDGVTWWQKAAQMAGWLHTKKYVFLKSFLHKRLKKFQCFLHPRLPMKIVSKRMKRKDS
jgi:hypothetical protein